MKKIITIVAFRVGVDVLGFPLFCNHRIANYRIVHSQFFNAFSKK
ncbi:hypothetical protein [Chryseobacterium sp. MFBS3-17]|nr:hypothetical protein [Chryseobacterium sp. MFBS3-17]